MIGIEPLGVIKPLLQICSIASLYTHRVQQALSVHPASLVMEMSPSVLSLMNCQGFINMELEGEQEFLLTCELGRMDTCLVEPIIH